MITVEMWKMLEAIDTCVRCDLFTEIEADKIMQICYTAIGRAIREAEEGE